MLCAVTIVLDFVKLRYVADEFKNRMISEIVQQGCGCIAVILLLLRLDVRLFEKPQGWLYLIPGIIIAVDNFPFYSYFQGNMRLAETEAMDFILFSGYCLAVGLFEECIFRGVIFSVLASSFSKDKKGFIKTYIVSSLIFGVAHLFNGFSAGTMLQVGYTILTGGLFAFVLIKTKNLLCCGFVHALYNFCGLIFSTQGMGMGVVFDLGTALTMLIVSVPVGVFVLYKVFIYSDAERDRLYVKLGVKND